MSVILSGVEESGCVAFKVPLRDPSTSLGMTMLHFRPWEFISRIYRRWIHLRFGCEIVVDHHRHAVA
jgi:hypothetical protein